MTFHHFRKLHKDQQQEVIFEEGIYLMDLETNGFTISLFQLGSFYAELFYLRESGEIIWINCFEDTAKLSPYLDKIDLSALADCFL